MIPIRFLDRGDQPEFNSVDASLWYTVATHDCWDTLERQKMKPDPAETKRLQTAIEAHLDEAGRNITTSSRWTLLAVDQSVRVTTTTIEQQGNSRDESL